MKLLGQYDNGNYKVYMFDDGTKVRVADDDVILTPEFPENIDIKLTNICPIGCPYCHENSKASETPDYKTDLLDKRLLGSLNPYTEVALGGGALSAIDEDVFIQLLINLEERKIITNATVNQLELDNEKFYNILLNYYLPKKLINGLGISFKRRGDKRLEYLIKKYRSRVVVHVINGIATQKDFEYLKSLHCKILILGYKDFRRGDEYFKKLKNAIRKNQNNTEKNIYDYMDSFKSVSFDTLALEQLNIKAKVSKEEWSQNYLGDDGLFTMYIDVPNSKFAANSIRDEDSRLRLEDYNYNIREMFQKIRNQEEGK